MSWNVTGPQGPAGAPGGKGVHIKSGKLTLRKAGETPLVIKLTDVLISSDQTQASPGKNSAPTETLSFNFTRIEFKYQPQSTD